MRLIQKLLFCAFLCCILAINGFDAARAESESGSTELTSRVGATIGTEERTYFRLFPFAEDFTSAQIYSRPEGEVRIVVTCLNDTSADSVEIDLSAGAARQLVHYIEYYETLTAMPWGSEFGLIDSLIQWPPLKPVRRAVTVQTMDGRRVTGNVTLVDKHGLAVDTSGKPFDWRRKDYGVLLSSTEIADVRFSGIGALGGTAIGFFGTAVPLTLIGAAIYENEQSDPLAGFATFVYAVALAGPAVIVGTIVGALKGAESSRARKFTSIDGSPELFSRLAPRIRRLARYPIPPPEVVRAFERHLDLQTD